jgi:hypothetical protein
MKKPKAKSKDEGQPVEMRAAVDPRDDKFEPKLESKDDHVGHIAKLARKLQQTQPGAETLARDILHHVSAIQDPESYNRAAAEKQRIAFEAEQRGRS